MGGEGAKVRTLSRGETGAKEKEFEVTEDHLEDMVSWKSREGR